MNIISVKEIAHLVREERKNKGWTQAELAKHAAVSRDWLIGLEQAKPSVELALVLRTLKALGLKLSANKTPSPSSLTSRYLDSLKSHNKPDNTDQGHED